MGLWSSPWRERRERKRKATPRRRGPPPSSKVERQKQGPQHQGVEVFVPVSNVRAGLSKSVRTWQPPLNPDRLQRRQLGVREMRSERWFPRSSTKVRTRGIPFISNSGHITGSTLYYWKCSSAQWFATLCRSVWKKLSRRNGKKSIKTKLSKDLIARIAVYYSIKQSEGDLERVLHCHAKRARGLLHHLVCNMDDPQRFLYGQMLQSISWLQSRGKPRAQSIEKFEIPDYRGLWTFDTVRDISIHLNWASDPWIVGPLRLSN